MTIRLNCLLLFTFLSLLFPFNNSYAEDTPYCDLESAQSDNLRRCAYQVLDKKDKDLNVIYQRVMKQLSPSEQKQLRQSERLWIKETYQKCNSPEALKEGGTTTDIECRTDRTVLRSNYLTIYESCHHKNKRINMMKKCLFTQYQ